MAGTSLKPGCLQVYKAKWRHTDVALKELVTQQDDLTPRVIKVSPCCPSVCSRTWPEGRVVHMSSGAAYAKVRALCASQPAWSCPPAILSAKGPRWGGKELNSGLS